MSVKSTALWVSLAILACPLVARAQSAEKVIERYVDAIGGKKALEKIVSTEISGRVTSADGRSGVFVQRTKRPNLFYTSLTVADVRSSSGFTGRAAWQDGSDGVRTLYGQAASRVRAEASYANTHFVLPDKVSQVYLVGREQVRDRSAIVVMALAPDGVKRTLFFDADTHLLVKDQQQTDAAVEERFFDDYRRIDQVMEPHRIEWRRNGETFQIVVERLAHNLPIDPATFAVPLLPAGPDLDTDAVLSAAARAEQRTQPVPESYTYTSTSTFVRFDDHGRTKQEEGETHEVFNVGGRMVTRLIRKLGGEALSEAERRREDERVSKLVREYERERLSQETVRRLQRHPGSGFVIVRMPLGAPEALFAYLRMSDFSGARREMLRGRAAIVVEFQPKPRANPNNDFERQVSKMAGTLWIDDASQSVMQLESYFTDDDNRNVQGSTLRVERTLVNDEVWLPSRVETNLRRSWAFKKFSNWIDAVQYSGYKKFNVESDFTVTLPDPSRR
jgi:hypothetical protein